MLGAQRTDGEAPKPPQISLETSLNHGHPVCTLAPSVTQGLKHPSCGAGRVLIRSASPERRPPSVPRTQAPQLRRRAGPHPLREPRASPAERPTPSPGFELLRLEADPVPIAASFPILGRPSLVDHELAPRALHLFATGRARDGALFVARLALVDDAFVAP